MFRNMFLVYMAHSYCSSGDIAAVHSAENLHAIFAHVMTVVTAPLSFSATKEEVPDNELEKNTEKEMTERVNEDTEMV